MRKEVIHFMDGFLGKIDGFLFYRRNRRRYVRKIKSKREKQKVPVAEQLLGQVRFRCAVALYRAIKESPLRVVWYQSPRPDGMTGYNNFIHYNYPAFDENGAIFDYARLRVSVGHVRVPFGMHVEPCRERAIVITWGTGIDELLGQVSDRLYVFLMYDDDSFRFVLHADLPVCRGDGYASISLAPEDEEPVHLYYFFGTADRRGFSESTYYRLTYR